MALLTVRNIVKSYPLPDGGVHEVLNVKEWSLSERQIVAISGSSGSGKTTFLNICAGIIKPDSGDVIFNAHNIVPWSESKRDRFRAKHIGYVFQTFNLLQGFTVEENLRLAMSFAGKCDRDYAMHLLQEVGLKGMQARYPRQLSVGQQQRVAVARALVNKPDIVLADEPTGNLDYANAMQTIGLIKDLCRQHNAALIVVSHDKGILAQFKNHLEIGAHG